LFYILEFSEKSCYSAKHDGDL